MLQDVVLRWRKLQPSARGASRTGAPRVQAHDVATTRSAAHTAHVLQEGEADGAAGTGQCVFQSVRWVTPDFCSESLRHAAGAMTKKAGGPDGWTAASAN